MEFQLSCFRSYKMMLWKCCTQYANKFEKLSSDYRNWKRSVFIPISKKGNAKECSNYYKIAVISHTNKLMTKILPARLQQYVNWELPNVWAGFKKRQRQRNQRSNCQHPLDHRKSKRVIEIHLMLLYWLHQNLWLFGSQQTVKNS